MQNPPELTASSDGFLVNTDLVVIQMVVVNSFEVVERLSNIFISKGYVKPSYMRSAIEREETCPTGLPTPGLGVAIPHGGLEHTIKPGIAIATLARPVEFGELGNPTSRVKVSVVFMLSVTQPESQIYLLQALMNVYKDEGTLHRLYNATNVEEIVKQVNSALAHSKAQIQL